MDSDTEVSKILAEALIVLCDFYRDDLTPEKILKQWARLAETVRSLPESSESVEVYQADARKLPAESDSVDLVLTSPPYINVHNYHQKFRRSVEALGWKVLTIAPSEIGSNRQNRGNRFVTVIQYALDMVLAIREMARVARPGARLILVLGRESTVRGVPFLNVAFHFLMENSFRNWLFEELVWKTSDARNVSSSTGMAIKYERTYCTFASPQIYPTKVMAWRRPELSRAEPCQ